MIAHCHLRIRALYAGDTVTKNCVLAPNHVPIELLTFLLTHGQMHIRLPIRDDKVSQ